MVPLRGHQTLHKMPHSPKRDFEKAANNGDRKSSLDSCSTEPPMWVRCVEKPYAYRPSRFKHPSNNSIRAFRSTGFAMYPVIPLAM